VWLLIAAIAKLCGIGRFLANPSWFRPTVLSFLDCDPFITIVQIDTCASERIPARMVVTHPETRDYAITAFRRLF
jgi:hypothetical protein